MNSLTVLLTIFFTIYANPLPEITEKDVNNCLMKLVDKTIAMNGNFFTQDQALEVILFLKLIS